MFGVVQNPEYVEAVRKSFAGAPAEVGQLINGKLWGLDCFFWGGAVRNPIYAVMYPETRLEYTDWDIIVDDSSRPVSLDEIFAQELRIGSCVHNRFGTIKLKPQGEGGLEIDVSSFTNVLLVRGGKTQEVSLASVLAGCDFNTGAIAYRPGDGSVYDAGAIAGLREKLIELRSANDVPPVIMARLVMHSNDMRFHMGHLAVSFIRQNYEAGRREIQDAEIAAYLLYKKKPQRYAEVTGRLREIACRNL